LSISDFSLKRDSCQWTKFAQCDNAEHRNSSILRNIRRMTLFRFVTRYVAEHADRSLRLLLWLWSLLYQFWEKDGVSNIWFLGDWILFLRVSETKMA
jgi:hypothetical protein